METIRVNMTPCEDIKTIHASQNDGEAREWWFILHNNGDVIDSSEITDQLVFKAYEGGTEQILPTNGSTPTTSPFKGDIKYPQGLLTDQEFTYRESPTEEDGLANIVDIKGQTLKWNQLLNLTRVEETADGLSVSVNNGTVNIAGTNNTESRASFTLTNNGVWFQVDANDVILYIASNYSGFLYGRVGFSVNPNRTNGYISKADIAFSANPRIYVESGETVNISTKFSVFNLTKMFGSAKAEEIYQMEQSSVGSGVAYFRSLFPLDYYPYNSGSLIPFNANGIKTVGFNQWDEEWEAGALSVTDGSTINVNSYLRSKNFIPVISGKTYCRGISYQSDCRVFYYDANQNYVGNVATSSANTLFTIPSSVAFIKFHKNGANYDNNICINISNTSKNGTYEPYTESVINLPISTYFPSGMNKVNDTYDEWTPTKAVTRVGAVDLGSLTWVYESSIPRFYTTDINALIKKPVDNYAKANAISSMYENTTFNQLYATEKKNMTMAFGETGTFSIINTSYTDVNAFKTAMSGVYLYYELATPTETSFTTASLVTENAEIPLSNEDGILIGKCTEQLSENPGFIDAKIKLTDANGECYSNKIQLHVERSPQ